MIEGDSDGRRRAVIENVTPNVDQGRFPIKRTVGERIVVEADVFADGHDRLRAVVLYRHEEDRDWQETPMQALANDRWRTTFRVERSGRYRYTLIAWVDRFASWRHDLGRREQTEDIAVALLTGADLLQQAAGRAAGDAQQRLAHWADRLRSDTDLQERTALALSDELAATMARYPDRALATRHPREYSAVVDRERARFSAWYELFPRSCIDDPDGHGRFRDCTGQLAEIAAMGFDIVYLPPIHPIGHTNRKGRNNTLIAEADDPGSPWAIGSEAGGHKAVHPDLGTLEEFRDFVNTARGLGMEVALDIAFQCSPDHPWVREHPQWFTRRPDG